MSNVHPEVKKFVIRQIKSLVPEAQIKAFGSRINGTARKYSDLDICLHASKPIDFKVLAALEERFTESDIPYLVETVDYHLVSAEFQAIIDTSCEIWS